MSRHFFWVCFASILSTVFFSTSTMAQGEVVGSEKCQTCHQSIYETWKESTHFKATQEVTPSHDSVIAEWKGVVKVKSGNIPE